LPICHKEENVVGQLGELKDQIVSDELAQVQPLQVEIG
jgi:hypothetical protein